MGTDARPATTQRHQHNGEMVRIKMAEGGGGGGQGLGEDVFTCGRVLCAIMDVVKMMITAEEMQERFIHLPEKNPIEKTERSGDRCEKPSSSSDRLMSRMNIILVFSRPVS